MSVVRLTVNPMTTGTTDTSTDLTDDELAMLELEHSWWKFAGAKETRIRHLFGCSATVYYARLNALIDRPEALAADPLVVRRLLRLREARHAARTRAVDGFGRR